MADHGSSGTHSQDFQAHRATYEGFIKGSVILAMLSFYVLVALVAFRFVPHGNVLLGFAGLILGVIALLIDSRAGGKWYLSGGLLVIFAVITAVFVA
jgi:lipopolysaccharide export LptBFGC system permease protein LptF